MTINCLISNWSIMFLKLGYVFPRLGITLLLLISVFNTASCMGQDLLVIRKNIPLDSIRLSDPSIIADTESEMYYMTGTGGKLWKSKNLQLWEGPYNVVKINPKSWMGPEPMIWAAELHYYQERYYYFATFTNKAVKIYRQTNQRLMVPFG